MDHLDTCPPSSSLHSLSPPASAAPLEFMSFSLHLELISRPHMHVGTFLLCCRPQIFHYLQHRFFIFSPFFFSHLVIIKTVLFFKKKSCF